jgi:hypothetical protein
MATAEGVATVRQLWPLLAVEDIDRSINFYQNKLGSRSWAALKPTVDCSGVGSNAVAPRSCYSKPMRKMVLSATEAVASHSSLFVTMPTASTRSSHRVACNWLA